MKCSLINSHNTCPYNRAIYCNCASRTIGPNLFLIFPDTQGINTCSCMIFSSEGHLNHRCIRSLVNPFHIAVKIDAAHTKRPRILLLQGFKRPNTIDAPKCNELRLAWNSETCNDSLGGDSLRNLRVQSKCGAPR